MDTCKKLSACLSLNLHETTYIFLVPMLRVGIHGETLCVSRRWSVLCMHSRGEHGNEGLFLGSAPYLIGPWLILL